MPKHFKYLVALTACLFAATSSSAQVMPAISSLKQAKDIMDFYNSAIKNPTEIIILSGQIHVLFSSSPTRYKDISNTLLEKVGIFSNTMTDKDRFEVMPAPSPGYEYGYFSISMKKVTFKECQTLSHFSALNGNFVRVEQNGFRIHGEGAQKQPKPECINEWFFQDGKNEFKYVSF